ncbi:MAG: hypothetical protein K2F87_04325 [Muribaculaceae bacterium]|nr:hypothetical protein [Muribaculaceae bacterium]
MDFFKATQEDLHKYLVSIGKVDKILPSTPDIEDFWPAVLEAYLPDGVREFAEYPVVSLGWIMFMGMAVAKYWDEDWEKYQKEGGSAIYNRLRDEKSFDNLDDNILENVLGLDEKQAEATSKVVGECAARTLSALQHSAVEAGTAEAARAYIDALHALYLMGAAMELNALGYHMTPLSASQN